MITWIVTSSIRLRFLVAALAAVLLAVGTVRLRDKPIDMVPEFSPLTLQVKTEALGLSSTEVESLITVPLEADLLNGVPWLQSIESESMTGMSQIEMLFAPGTNLMKARQMVQERLAQAHALPNVSSPPLLLPPVSSVSRIMNIGLSSDTVSLIAMSVEARWTIVPRLLGVPGVANVSVWGQRERQIQVQVDPQRLHARGVTLEQVVKTAGEAVWASPLTFLNSSTPGTGGFIDTPNQRLGIRHVSPILTAKDFASIPVFGTSVPLGELADVVEDHQPLIGDAILKDGPGLMLVVEKFPGSNTVGVTRGVERALAELTPGLGGIKIDTSIYRPASFIERATHNVSLAVLLAVGLAVLGMLALFGGWRTALIGVIAMAVSLTAALLVLDAFGTNVNMITLAGLLLAIGAVVDDAVVSMAGMRRRQQAAGQDGEVALRGRIVGAALETRRPLLYATAIAVLAVLPLLFMHGLSALFFEPLVQAYLVTVLASLLVALTLTPALAMLLLPGTGAAADTPLIRWLWRPFGYAAARTAGAPVLAAITLVAALPAGYLLWTQSERAMIPNFKETDFLVEWQATPGTSLQAMNRVTGALIQDLKSTPGVRNVAAHVGRALLSRDIADVNSAEVWVSIDPAADYDHTIEALRKKVSAYPGVDGTVQTYLSKKMRESLTGEEEAITVRVYGEDLAILRTKADEISAMLAGIEGVRDARVEPQAEQTSLQVEVDLDKALGHGLKPGDVRRAASSLVSGITVGALFEQQKVFDVVVWGVPEVRRNLDQIQNLLIDTDSGRQVRLAEVAKVRPAASSAIIQRQGVSRYIDVGAEVSGRPLAAVSRDVAERIGRITFPFEYHARVLGEHTEQQRALASVSSYLIAAAVLGFLLLQAALRSWRLAALAVAGLPLALLGGLIAVRFDQGIITLGTLLGLFTVLTLSLRNNLLLLRRFQSLEHDDGEPFGAALVLRGIRERFAAILTTLVITTLVVLPLVLLGDRAGLEIANPAAVAIIGGVVTSALLTLFVLPALYLLLGANVPADPLQLDPETPDAAARAVD